MKKDQRDLKKSEVAGKTGEGNGDQTKPRALTSSALVKQAQGGDEAAFEDLVRPYIRKAYHVALKITRNREDAEDASQQSLLKAYSHIGQFQEDSHFSTWLIRIAINEALMVVRKRRSEDCFLSYEVDPGQESGSIGMLRSSDAFHPETLYEKGEAQRVLRQAIDGLRSTSRDVVWLLGLQERPTKEAAKILNLSQSAVKTRFLRARVQLRESLADRI
ncbi:MAG TPA: sigma-70 family RNA polymerase sigma factor [Candidatus Dormibacteraeota bacterium]|nr:sigma-70 family RNA polymerase sigma factor [Candidatus Dormibacteraeota bacterium]